LIIVFIYNILDYFFTKEYFTNNKIDLALCNQFGDACVEAASVLNIPYIVTTALDITKGKSLYSIKAYRVAYVAF
jgi:hypothetical protein